LPWYWCCCWTLPWYWCCCRCRLFWPLFHLNAGNADKFSVAATFPQSQCYRGWRQELIRIASDCFAYYESPETSVVYNEDSSLTANMWFKSEENLRTFINRVAETHLSYRLPTPIVWEYDFEAATAPHVRPVMTMDYSKGES
jgi:hypothetical protein